MLARRKIALLDGALVAEALGALQEKFGAFATAKAAYGARLQMTAGLRLVASSLLNDLLGIRDQDSGID